jgi:hypothetical protein
LFDDSHHVVFEPHFNETISFVQYKHFYVFQRKTLGVLKMVLESSRCCNDEIRTSIKLVALLSQGGTSKNGKTREVRDVLSHQLEHTVALDH